MKAFYLFLLHEKIELLHACKHVHGLLTVAQKSENFFSQEQGTIANTLIYFQYRKKKVDFYKMHYLQSLADSWNQINWIGLDLLTIFEATLLNI